MHRFMDHGHGAFYLPDGDSFVATPLARGPWSNDHQHGGPPAALVGRAMEALGEDARSYLLVRLTIEILRPVPLDRVQVSARFLSEGKVAQRLEAVLSSGGKDILRATGLRLRRREPPLPADTTTAPPEAAPPPGGLESFQFPFFQHDVGYHRAIDVRFARGKWGERDVVVWARPTVPLVLGEPLSPLSRVLIMVDAESGICPPVAASGYTFINPDLTLYLERPLAGEWLGLAIRSAAQPEGIGIAESALFDAKGTFGRSAQSLTVAPRQ
jgi:hypothetical protein